MSVGWLVERLGRSNRLNPVAYKIPLLTIGDQLPFDLLSTGMWWVWQSSRKIRRRLVPNLPRRTCNCRLY